MSSRRSRRETRPRGWRWRTPARTAAAVGLGILAWWLVYSQLARAAGWVTYDLLRFGRGSALGSSIEFFFYDTPKVLMLLTIVVFGVGIIRSFFTPERTRRLLAGRRESIGSVRAALFGVVTPFCSCSAVPLGTVLAFMMAVIGLSLPETVILRKVLTVRLIAVFIGVVGAGILMVGYLFNFLL